MNDIHYTRIQRIFGANLSARQEAKKILVLCLEAFKTQYPDVCIKYEVSNLQKIVADDDLTLIKTYSAYYHYLKILRQVTSKQVTDEELQDLGCVIGPAIFYDHFDQEIVDIFNIYAHYMDLPPEVSGKPHKELKQWALELIQSKMENIKTKYLRH